MRIASGVVSPFPRKHPRTPKNRAWQPQQGRTTRLAVIQPGGLKNRSSSRQMKHRLFQEVAQPTPQAKVCVEACSLAFYRRLSRRKGFNENSFYKGEAANRIKLALQSSSADSKSIALPRGNGVRFDGAMGARGCPRRKHGWGLRDCLTARHGELYFSGRNLFHSSITAPAAARLRQCHAT